jgi:uncharacterized membrane protein
MATPFPRLTPAQFASPGLCYAKPLYGLANRRLQPERYMPFAANFLKNYLTLMVYSSIIGIWQIFFCPNLSVAPCHPWHGDFAVLSCRYIKGVYGMKNLKKCALISMVAIIVLCFSFVGCDDKTPDPVAQTKTLTDVTTGSGSVTVKIHYMAVSGTTPGYMTTLESIIRSRLTAMDMVSGILTINVSANATNGGFVLTDTKTLSVRESWISNATEDEMIRSLNSVRSDWIM